MDPVPFKAPVSSWLGSVQWPPTGRLKNGIAGDPYARGIPDSSIMAATTSCTRMPQCKFSRASGNAKLCNGQPHTLSIAATALEISSAKDNPPAHI
jgi:hypothetical protein